MLRNFLLVASRNLFRQRVYSIINISGLAIGIACSVLILLWLEDEVNYDRFIPKSENLHVVMIKGKFQGELNAWKPLPLPAYDEVKKVNSNVVDACLMTWGEEPLVTAGDKAVVKNGHYVSEEFLKMFEFPIVKGAEYGALDDASSIVITESLAEVLFGDEDPLGKTIKIDNENLFQVSAILADLPVIRPFSLITSFPGNGMSRSTNGYKAVKTGGITMDFRF